MRNQSPSCSTTKTFQLLRKRGLLPSKTPLSNLPWVMRWLHLLPQPNTFPDVQSNFHLKLHNHGIKVCSLPPPSCLPFSWHKSNIWRSLIPLLGVALFYRYMRLLSSPSTHFQIPRPG